MDDSFRDEESVAFAIPGCRVVPVKIDGSFQDDLPLVVVRMCWEFYVVVKMHEDDLVVCALDEIAGESWYWYVYLRESLYGCWEQLVHAGSPARRMSPCRYVVALPEMWTRSLTSLQCNCPCRLESCLAESSVLFSCCAQYGISVVCAEPVTGSSLMPTLGAKNRETKSLVFPGAVMMVPRALTCERRW